MTVKHLVFLVAAISFFAAPPILAQEELGASRDNPVPMGEMMSIGDYTVRVVAYIPDATQIVLDENQFNDEPTSGSVFVIITVELGYEGSDIGDASIIRRTASYVGSQNVGYDGRWCGVIPNDSSDYGDIFPGGDVEFNLCQAIPENEVNDLVMYLNIDDEFRIFFELDSSYVDAEATPSATPVN